MVAPVDIGFIGFFMPIFAFLLVAIVVYAVLQKTEVLGNNSAVSLFVSFIMASFFIVEVQLVDFVGFTTSWFSVLVIIMFFLFIAIGFVPGDEPFKFLSKNNWFSWAVLVLMIVFFIISSSYIFNWAINWDWFMSGADSEWFGFLLLVVIGGVVAWVLKEKATKG
jgi:hypothetical protein